MSIHLGCQLIDRETKVIFRIIGDALRNAKDPTSTDRPRADYWRLSDSREDRLVLSQGILKAYLHPSNCDNHSQP